ncbi:MAG: 30S ribosomal protein S9 [Planctomycetota bacterium]
MDQDASTAVLDAPTQGLATEGLTPDAPETPAPRPLRDPAKPDLGGFVWGTGRRKSSVARVRVRPAKEADGKFLVNGKPVDHFFSEPQHRADCTRALEATSTLGKLDVFVNVHGGGITGQSGAILLGVARALIGYDPSLEHTLRDLGYTTRDPREVERKKYGQRGARRRFQFSKR